MISAVNRPLQSNGSSEACYLYDDLKLRYEIDFWGVIYAG